MVTQRKRLSKTGTTEAYIVGTHNGLRSRAEDNPNKIAPSRGRKQQHKEDHAMRITQPSTTGPIVTPKRGLTRKDQKPDPVATGQAGKQKVSNTADQKKAKPRSYTS